MTDFQKSVRVLKAILNRCNRANGRAVRAPPIFAIYTLVGVAHSPEYIEKLESDDNEYDKGEDETNNCGENKVEDKKVNNDREAKGEEIMSIKLKINVKQRMKLRLEVQEWV